MWLSTIPGAIVTRDIFCAAWVIACTCAGLGRPAPAPWGGCAPAAAGSGAEAGLSFTSSMGSIWKTIRVEPREISSPCDRTRSATRSPLTNVPLSEPRSLSTHLPSI